MLEYLRIRGLALLDDVSLDFEPGMNVLTGETGAGKSIIVDALMLVRGIRGRADLVRDGDQAARVEAQFGVDPALRGALTGALAEHGIDLPDEEGLVVERVVSRSGRGRSVVQGSLTTLGVLSAMGERLIDICSQHEHHSLAHVARHLELLDAYASNEQTVADYTVEYAAWREALASLASMRERAAERTKRADYLRFQIEELDRVAPQAGEHGTLEARVTLMRQAHRWQAFAHEARDVLYEADDAVATRLGALLDQTRRNAPESGALVELDEQLEAALVACEEAAAAAGRLGEEVALEPEELDEAEERLHELERLRRKHGCEVEDLPQRLAAMQAELAELDNLDDHLAALLDRERERRKRCEELARALSKQRRAAAGDLVASIERELTALHIPDARLEARVVAESELGPRGQDRVEFLFSANAGEPVAPLTKVASGGELSRVLLAIKGVLATGDAVSTYVFDEVDAGVGGAVAEAIGRRLFGASNSRQVLCITHLPQIAAFADAHYRVEKRREGKRTVTRVVRLSAEERVEELARMLGGAKVTASARKHARELLDEARRGGDEKGAARRRKRGGSRPRAR